jgi:hypothetical protein
MIRQILDDFVDRFLDPPLWRLIEYTTAKVPTCAISKAGSATSS